MQVGDEVALLCFAGGPTIGGIGGEVRGPEVVEEESRSAMDDWKCGWLISKVFL